MTDIDTLVARLGAVHTDPIGCGLVRQWPVNPDGEAAIAAIRTLQTEKAELREAAKPFASHVGKSGEKVTLSIGKDTWTGTLSTDDFERLRQALSNTGEQEGDTP